jgi:tetratricopeptide (TPR) repeat protein/tRNA A-37 threonylcarbamoyl transferase component Bud32
MPDLLERLALALADRYTVESEIGRGGMATVYLAEDLRHDRKVAIKVLHPELAASVGAERFLQEIKTVAGLTHPHVLPLYDSGEADGLLYFVMPYVEGESLRQRLEREKQLPVEEAIRIAREVADALDHAHRNEVIHRDIKPANILLEEGHAVVTDFGVARAISAAGGEKVTATGMAVGTPAYMSPEQASGEEVDERSDIYALGCVLYEMLAGEPPLTGATPQSTAAKRLTDRPTPLGAMRSTVPGRLESLVERTLATSAVDRPATARQLAEELAEVRRSPEPAARRSPAARWLVPVLGLTVIAVVVAIVSMLTTDRSATRQARLLPVGADLGAQSIAVLPFANNTGADSLDWLRIGLADMLATNLAQLEAVRVVGVERLLDLMRQAGREETDRIPEDLALNIAAASGARTMIRAALAGGGSRLRMDVRLIDVSDGTIISAEPARGADLFALVDDVSARLLSRVLGEAITPTELTPVAQLTTTSLEAFREYQAGLLATNRFLPADAIEHYQRAVELDSTFALAWLGLGISTRGQMSADYLQRAEEYSADAPERDRLLIQAFLGIWEGGEYAGYFEELVAKYPDEKLGRVRLSDVYRDQGRHDEGRRLLEEVLRLDPYFIIALNQLIYLEADAGNEAAADSLSLRFIELEPDQWNPFDTRADILRMFGRHEESRAMHREAIRRNPRNRWSYWRLVRSYVEEGDPAGGRAALQPFLTTDDPDVAVYTRWLEAFTYTAEARYLAALDAYRGALAKATDVSQWPDLPANIGAHANATGAYEEAEEAFRELDRIEQLRGRALFGILSTNGKQGRFDEMTRVRDAAAADIDAAPESARMHIADGLIAWYRDGDAGETVRLFGEGRAAAGLTKTDALGSVQGEEVLALIAVGRASDALGIIDDLERFGTDDTQPILVHTAWYLRGRAYDAMDEAEPALESYERLLDLFGDRVREVVLFRDTPERVARLRGEP